MGNELDGLILKKRPEFDFPSKLDEDLIPDKEEPETQAPAEDANAAAGNSPDEPQTAAPPADTPTADESSDEEPKE